VAAASDMAVIQDSKGSIVSLKGVAHSLVADGGPVPADQVVIKMGAQGMRLAPGARSSHARAVKAETARSSSPSVVAALAPTYQWVQGACFTRLNRTNGYMDTCYAGYKMVNETDSASDYFAIDLWASFWGIDPGLEEAYLRTYVTSTPRYWGDWSPRQGSSSGCRNVTVGITGSLKAGDYGQVGGSLSSQLVFCETIDITKQNPAVDFKIHWDYCQAFCFVGMRDSRSLEMMIAWAGRQGAAASWTNQWNVW
jgi:hypothetical protein